MIVLDDRYGYDFDLSCLEDIKEYLTSKEVELIFVSDSDIADINQRFREKNTPTDVLSFPLEEMPNSPIGSIVISIDHIKSKANQFGHSEIDELRLMFIHGLLHLLGYDHEDDQGQMRDKERELIVKFNLPDSLIVRSE